MRLVSTVTCKKRVDSRSCNTLSNYTVLCSLTRINISILTMQMYPNCDNHTNGISIGTLSYPCPLAPCFRGKECFLEVNKNHGEEHMDPYYSVHIVINKAR